jgi:hypothetical protein
MARADLVGSEARTGVLASGDRPNVQANQDGPAFAMSTSIEITGLTRFETGEDGASISLLAEDISGHSVRLVFPTDVLSSLTMTLPKMLTTAIQRRRNDPSARLVYPLAAFKMELSTDLSTRILTLMTPDGFTVSFAVSDDQFRELAQSHARSGELRSRLAN